MACAVAMRSVFVSMHLSPFFSPSQLISASFRHLYSAHHNFGIRVSRAYDVVPFRLRCSQAETPSPDDQEPPQEVILKAITGEMSFFFCGWFLVSRLLEGFLVLVLLLLMNYYACLLCYCISSFLAFEFGSDGCYFLNYSICI